MALYNCYKLGRVLSQSLNGKTFSGLILETKLLIENQYKFGIKNLSNISRTDVLEKYKTSFKGLSLH
jgi:hypothetical protein